MERISVPFFVGNTGDNAENFLTFSDKFTGQTLCRSSKEREIQMIFFGSLLALAVQMANDR